MKKYNRDKRARCKANTRTQVDAMRDKHTQDTHDTHGEDRRTRIHITIRYDGYKQTQYDKEIIRVKRTSEAQRYVNITNTINDIFPEINAPHNKHIHRANCEYHKFIPPRTRKSYTEERIPGEYEFTYLDTTDTRTVKCIIFNSKDEIIYTGKLRRTIKTYIYGGENGKPHAEITLHKGDRDLRVRPYIPLMDTIHGVSIEYIRAHGVELYHI